MHMRHVHLSLRHKDVVASQHSEGTHENCGEHRGSAVPQRTTTEISGTITTCENHRLDLGQSISSTAGVRVVRSGKREEIIGINSAISGFSRVRTGSGLNY